MKHKIFDFFDLGVKFGIDAPICVLLIFFSRRRSVRALQRKEFFSRPHALSTQKIIGTEGRAETSMKIHYDGQFMRKLFRYLWRTCIII